MNKIDFIRMLVNDIEEEQAYIEEFKEADRKFKVDEKVQGDKFQYWNHPFYCMRVPSRMKIKDDAKMIRRLVLEISKE